MNFVKEYLEETKQGRYIMLRSFLHGIKHESREDCFEYFSNFDFSLYTEKEQIDLVRLTVFVSHAFLERFGVILDWSNDPRLTLTEPFKDRGYTGSWFFQGPQIFRKHNFYMSPSALEVM